MTPSLYDRLGGSDGIRAICRDLVALHRANPRIAPRFAEVDPDALGESAARFFITGSGGPALYEGPDMVAVHQGMNIDGEEFLAVLDDALQALNQQGVGQREQEEVLFILYSLKPQVMML
ncbi:group I truncated hemoglobin [Ferrimonas balearica]|uniref:group I truncated hemoglobin n=1 Tax=Ferrimonas balearica TaxID=44012 RepID=UPI001C99ACAD|nr:group 1 truncated hemoglobin [Ferrimonas balearica]MBY5993109.1 group 1 truncated hemoglobin [Ferrimonas balearica]